MKHLDALVDSLKGIYHTILPYAAATLIALPTLAAPANADCYFPLKKAKPAPTATSSGKSTSTYTGSINDYLRVLSTFPLQEKGPSQTIAPMQEKKKGCTGCNIDELFEYVQTKAWNKVTIPRISGVSIDAKGDTLIYYHDVKETPRLEESFMVAESGSFVLDKDHYVAQIEKGLGMKGLIDERIIMRVKDQSGVYHYFDGPAFKPKDAGLSPYNHPLEAIVICKDAKGEHIVASVKGEINVFPDAEVENIIRLSGYHVMWKGGEGKPQEEEKPVQEKTFTLRGIAGPILSSRWIGHYFDNEGFFIDAGKHQKFLNAEADLEGIWNTGKGEIIFTHRQAGDSDFWGNDTIPAYFAEVPASARLDRFTGRGFQSFGHIAIGGEGRYERNVSFLYGIGTSIDASEISAYVGHLVGNPLQKHLLIGAGITLENVNGKGQNGLEFTGDAGYTLGPLTLEGHGTYSLYTQKQSGFDTHEDRVRADAKIILGIKHDVGIMAGYDIDWRDEGSHTPHFRGIPTHTLRETITSDVHAWRVGLTYTPSWRKK